MTREEAVNILKDWDGYFIGHSSDDVYNALDMAIKALEKEPCEDAISRKAVIDTLAKTGGIRGDALKALYDLPHVTPQPKMGHCKDCKYFEYDSVAKVDGIPLIVAHEICKRWGDGCKSKEDGYCFLFEPQESDDKE